MDERVQEKKNSLRKYIPFIDFILKIDETKYKKFEKIRHWIISDKKYPLDALNKIEKSINTQYQNLLLKNDMKIPEEITNIFVITPMKLQQFVNLCSDEDEDDEAKQNVAKTNSNKKPNQENKQEVLTESDDDLIIISTDYVEKPKVTKELNKKKATKTNSQEKHETTNLTYSSKKNTEIEEASLDILSKIDELVKDDIKKKNEIHEPINYTYQEKDFQSESEDHKVQHKQSNIFQEQEDNIFQRRKKSNEKTDELFKRRKDFQNNENLEKQCIQDKVDEVEVQSLEYDESIETKHFNQRPIEIILDSSSDTDNEDDQPSTSKRALEKLTKKETSILKTKEDQLNKKSNDDKYISDLGDSIESLYADIDDVLDDAYKNNSDDAATKSPHQTNEVPTAVESKKENLLQETTNKLSATDDKIIKLNKDDITKIDVNVEVLSSALKLIKQNCSGNLSPVSYSSQTKPVETPPPAPPPINCNKTSPFAQNILAAQLSTNGIYAFNASNHCYPSQIQLIQNVPQYSTLSQYPQHNNNLSNINPGIPAPIPKPNDPRIKKQLDNMKNSPLMSILNPTMSANFMQYFQSQKHQQAPHTTVQLPGYELNKPLSSNATPSSLSKTSTSYTAANISYGEHKRRQMEKRWEEERLREERKAELVRQRRLEEERKSRDEIIKQKKEEIRSQLLSTLKPCEHLLTTIWQKTKNNLSSNPADKVKDTSNERTLLKQREKYKTKLKTKRKKNINNNNQYKENERERKLQKMRKELECSVKGYDNLNISIVNNTEKPNNNTETENLKSKPIGLKRRSSINALAAISEQIKQTNSSDIEMSQKSNCSTNSSDIYEPKRRLTDISFETISSQETRFSSPKERRKTIDEVIKPTKRSNKLRLVDDEDDSKEITETSFVNAFSSNSEESIKNSQENLNVGKPIIKLRRLSENTIRKYTNTSLENDDFNKKLKKKCEKPAAIDSFTNSKQIRKTKRNNDCQMTERNTSFCVLCNSKPSDLTNHYIGRHKTESYVSRLDWSELEDLTVNTPIAKLLPKTKNYRYDRYEVKCPFCKDIIQNTFMNLYQHYSSHTGEYAFKCDHCNLTKPYRVDIHSHILHSKKCLNSNIKVLYRYSANTQCIYLHYCVICNFVQINEANVSKHLRDHHDPLQNVPSNMAKCILVAMSDGPEVNETIKSPTPSPTPSPAEQVTANEPIANVQENIVDSTINFKVDDDDIPVGNEPCLEDDEQSVEDLLKQLHKEPSTTRNSITTFNIGITQIPMTVIHGTCNESERIVRKPIPIKNEVMDIEEKCHLIPQRPSTITPNDSNPVLANALNIPRSFITYEIYRSYPTNVNYLGLYKCMIDDCYYSTNVAEEFSQHLFEHNDSDVNVQHKQPLQCPYCINTTGMVMDPRQLIQHIRSHHSHMIYQCSLCCYRSCDASNVNVHQHLHHVSAIESCKIYKCFEVLEQNSNDLTFKPSMEELVEKNVTNICCKLCDTKFNHTQFLLSHLTNVHKKHIDHLEIYSCLYCRLMSARKDELRYHLSTKHPDEMPRIYDHNILSNNEDIKNPLNIIELNETVDFVELTPTINNISVKELDEQIQDTADIKPNLEQLMEMNEETLRVRLRKLTKHTGIQPDNLYRCPETKCGGFFSNYDLWLRHMKNRHQCIECQCPHCPFVDSLQRLEIHFEQHRRHTFICFHCPTTFASDLIAREHFANNHNDVGEIRTENIRFNISYCYSIMLKNDLYQERQTFITELLKLIDERLKKLEDNESKTLKQQWPVQDNALWIDEYKECLKNRIVSRNCIINCGFHTAKPDLLYEHMRSTHVIDKTTFNCSTCDFQLKDCANFNDIIDHVKIHNISLSICTVCVSQTTSNRYKMSLHIEKQHRARDVPVVRLLKNNHQLFVEIYIVFADNCLTFSTIKNCFCCPEKNMNPERFALHLKRYHKFTLIYYCEKCKTNTQFQSLDAIKTHFQQEHSTEKLKIRCKLFSKHDLQLISINDLQVEILTDQQLISSSVEIKNEPMDVADEDDDVILLEDNDIVIENIIKEAKQQKPIEKPKIKCASLGELMQPTTTTHHIVNNIYTNYQQPPTSIMQNSSVFQHLTNNSIPINLYGSRSNTNVSPSVKNSIPYTTTVYAPYINNNNINNNVNINITNSHSDYMCVNNNNLPRNEQNTFLSTPVTVNNTNLSSSRLIIPPQIVTGNLGHSVQQSINLPTCNILMSRVSSTNNAH